MKLCENEANRRIRSKIEGCWSEIEGCWSIFYVLGSNGGLFPCYLIGKEGLKKKSYCIEGLKNLWNENI